MQFRPYDEYYGDLGDEKRKVEIPCGADAREDVLDRGRVDFGHRPEDWLARDLLVGGALRDPRAMRFRRLVKNRDPRMYWGLTLATPRDDHTPIAQCRALHYLWLAKVREMHGDLADDDPHAANVLARLHDCPSALLRTPDYRADACGYEQLCPFCLARLAKSLYRRLVAEYGPGRQKCLVLLQASATDEDLDDCFGPKYERCGRVAKAMRAKLRSLARRWLGVTGGLSTFSAGPLLYDDAEWVDGELSIAQAHGLEYHGAVLGEVAIKRLVELADAGELDRGYVEPIDLGGEEIPVLGDVLPCRSRDALRRLLVGGWPQADSDEGDDYGALRWPPWFLADSDQWRAYRRAIGGIPTFRFFGDWRERFRVGPRATTDKHYLEPINKRRRRGRRITPLKGANCERRVAKADAVAELAAAALPVFEELMRERGKAPGRAVLTRELETRGIKVPARQQRPLVARLKDLAHNQ